MPTHDAEAVVLRQYTLSEADRIIVLFTREHGKLRAVAPGAKRLKSRIGGCLEPLNHVRIHYYLKEGADLARIRHCETICSYLGKKSSVERLYAYTYMAEIVQEISQENNQNPLLFRLFLATLNACEKAGVRKALLRYFEFWSLKLSGLLPNYAYCSACGKCVKEDGFYASLEDGQGRCETCSSRKGIRIGPGAAELLRVLTVISPDQFASRLKDEKEGKELEQLAQRLLELHIERRLKSFENLNQMLRGI
jgi:DNA repair protein RecO (recombination protein O)